MRERYVDESVYLVFKNDQNNGDSWIPLISNITNDEETHRTTKVGMWRV